MDLQEIVKSAMEKDYAIASNHHLTPQEHGVLGSGCTQTDRDVYSLPYTPLAVQLGECTVEEANVLRMQHGVGCMLICYEGKNGFMSKYLLPPLDLNKESPTYGQTLKDPELLNPEYFLDLPLDIERLEFPFKRS